VHEGDAVELVVAVPHRNLKAGLRGVVVRVLPYWNLVRVRFENGVEAQVTRDKLRVVQPVQR